MITTTTCSTPGRSAPSQATRFGALGLLTLLSTLLLGPGVSPSDDGLTIAPAEQATDQMFTAPAGALQAWHLKRVQAPEAWAATTGVGVTIAIIDSGIDAQHPDLKGRVLPGWNVLEDQPDTTDATGHGTAVAGAAAAGFSQAQGAAGVAAGARILPLKVTNGTGHTSINAVVKAIYRAADQGARVVNVSFEVVASHPAVLRAALYLQERGGVLVVPSGNRGERLTLAPSPAVITVAATDQDDEHPRWSTQGAHVSVSAPGKDLLVAVRGGRHGTVTGTSYASPLVAGVLALMIAAHPEATPQQLRQALESSALDLGEPGHDPAFGHGRIDAQAALRALAQQRQAQPQAAQPNPAAPRAQS